MWRNPSSLCGFLGESLRNYLFVLCATGWYLLMSVESHGTARVTDEEHPQPIGPLHAPHRSQSAAWMQKDQGQAQELRGTAVRLTMRYCGMLGRRRAPTAGAKQVQQVGGWEGVQGRREGPLTRIAPRERCRKADGLAQGGHQCLGLFTKPLLPRLAVLVYDTSRFEDAGLDGASAPLALPPIL